MAKNCIYAGKEYSDGAVVCQNGYEYRCNDGTWDALNTTCLAPDGARCLPKDPQHLPEAKRSPLDDLTAICSASVHVDSSPVVGKVAFFSGIHVVELSNAGDSMLSVSLSETIRDSLGNTNTGSASADVPSKKTVHILIRTQLCVQYEELGEVTVTAVTTFPKALSAYSSVTVPITQK